MAGSPPERSEAVAGSPPERSEAVAGSPPERSEAVAGSPPEPPHPPEWPPAVPPWRPAPDRPAPRPPPARPTPVVPTVTGPSRPAEGDVFGRLFERRVVLLTGRLEDEAATRATAQLMLLDATGDEPVDLHLSCPDGDLDAATALADTIDLVGAEVRAVCSGRVGGPVLAPLVAAHRRLAHAHCLFVLKDPRVELQGRAELATLAAAQERQLRGLHARLAEATGQPLDRVASDMRKGVTLTAREAMEYGLVQEIVSSGKR